MSGLSVNGQVVFNRQQNLSDSQKQQGRDNLGIENGILAYLQSLPTTLPSEPNMPWWDNDVLKRSSTILFVIQSGIWVDTGIWIDSETWSDN